MFKYLHEFSYCFLEKLDRVQIFVCGLLGNLVLNSVFFPAPSRKFIHFMLAMEATSSSFCRKCPLMSLALY